MVDIDKMRIAAVRAVTDAIAAEFRRNRGPREAPRAGRTQVNVR